MQEALNTTTIVDGGAFQIFSWKTFEMNFCNVCCLCNIRYIVQHSKIYVFQIWYFAVDQAIIKVCGPLYLQMF